MSIGKINGFVDERCHTWQEDAYSTLHHLANEIERGDDTERIVTTYFDPETGLYAEEEVVHHSAARAKEQLKAELRGLQNIVEKYAAYDTDDPLVVFPKYIRDRVRAMLDQAVAAGYLNEKYQFTKEFGKGRAGVLANHIADNLDLSRRWKCFEQLWNVKNLRQNWKNYSKTEGGEYFLLVVENEIE